MPDRPYSPPQKRTFSTRRKLLVERDLLRHDAEPPLAADRIDRQIDAVERDAPRVGREQAGQHRQRRRLAGPVGSEKPVDLTSLDLEGDAVHGGLVPELLGQPFGTGSREALSDGHGRTLYVTARQELQGAQGFIESRGRIARSPHPLTPSPISHPLPRRERGNPRPRAFNALGGGAPLPGLGGWEMGEGSGVRTPRDTAPMPPHSSRRVLAGGALQPLCFFEDAAEHGLRFAENGFVRETENRMAEGAQIAVPVHVMSPLTWRLMYVPVELDDQLEPMAVEVRAIDADRRLTAELEPLEASIAEQSPKRLLGRSGRLPELTGSAVRKWAHNVHGEYQTVSRGVLTP